jgi:hypothetical protein
MSTPPEKAESNPCRQWQYLDDFEDGLDSSLFEEVGTGQREELNAAESNEVDRMFSREL